MIVYFENKNVYVESNSNSIPIIVYQGLKWKYSAAIYWL